MGHPSGNDARVYLAATRAWLTGGDPWAVESEGIRFAGPPTALLPFAPFASLAPEAVTALILAASIAAAIFVVRRLELPLWWLLFPPLVEALWSGSVIIVVLALMLTPLEWLGVVVKTYAGVPSVVLGHVRQLAIAAAVIVVTIPLLPWARFFDHVHHDLAAVITTQTWGGRSAWIAPLALVPISVVCLALLGRRRAAWFATPVLWPATQFPYAIFAMPARPTALATAILAVPLPGAPVVAIVAEVIVRRLRVSAAGRRLDTSEDTAVATS